MKKKLFFIATTLYSNAQAVRCSIKSAWYAVIAFIAACLMIIAPVSISKATTSGEDIAKNFPVSSDIMYEVIKELDDNGITCKIENQKFICDDFENVSNKYVKTSVYKEKEYKYTVVLLDSNYDYKKIDNEKAQDDDNIIYFGEDYFYIREIGRNDLGESKSSISVSGDYRLCGGFDFERIVNTINNESEDAARIDTYYMFSNFLYHVSLSDFYSIMFLWLLLGIVCCLICVLSGAFVLNYGNKKGNLADEYGWRGSLKIAFNILLLPAIISVGIGFIMPESVIMTLPIVYFIRIFFIYRAQFTRKGQKLAIKTHKGLEDLI